MIAKHIFWDIVGALILPPLEWATRIYECLFPPTPPEIPNGPHQLPKFRGPRFTKGNV